VEKISENSCDCIPAHGVFSTIAGVGWFAPEFALLRKPAQALDVSADEELGLEPARNPRPVGIDDNPETRRLWKRFQMDTQLPERADRKSAPR